MTYFDLYDEGRIKLFKLQEGENDARLLLLWTLGIDMGELLANYTTSDVSDELAEKYRELIKLRATGTPLQYITHVQNFCGLDFYVDENVLVPRFDTEVMVDKILTENDSGRVLDICTGSGCIAVTLARLGHFDEVYGSDISRRALEIADSNAEANGVTITFYESDMFKQLGDLTNLDIIVCNPPYIKSAVIDTLMPEVRDHEPRMALDGDADGLRFYRIIAEEAPKHLKSGGKLYLEIGFDQAEEVSELLKKNFKDIEVTKDLSQLDRVISCSII